MEVTGSILYIKEEENDFKGQEFTDIFFTCEINRIDNIPFA